MAGEKKYLNDVDDIPNIPNTNNIITPPQLTSDQDDYNPTGFGPGVFMRLDINSNNREITGLVAPAAGVNAVVAICNINASGDDLRFMNNDSGSAAANRFLLRDNSNKSIKPNETAIFWYDHVSTRWRPYNRVG